MGTQEEARALEQGILGGCAARVLQCTAERLPEAVRAGMRDGTLEIRGAVGGGDESSDGAHPGMVDWEGRRALLQRLLARFQQVGR